MKTFYVDQAKLQAYCRRRKLSGRAFTVMAAGLPVAALVCTPESLQKEYPFLVHAAKPGKNQMSLARFAVSAF